MIQQDRIKAMLYPSFVHGNSECEFYAFIRSNQEQKKCNLGSHEQSSFGGGGGGNGVGFKAHFR